MNALWKMPDPFQPKKFSVPSVREGTVKVICPICGYDEFLAVVPDLEWAKREGFRHVIMGVYGDATLAAQAVRFQHCANCGYVMNFIIGNFPANEKGGS